MKRLGIDRTPELYGGDTGIGGLDQSQTSGDEIQFLCEKLYFCGKEPELRKLKNLQS